MPIIRSSTAAVAASGLPSERGGSSAVGRGRAGLPAVARSIFMFYVQISFGEQDYLAGANNIHMVI